MVGRRGAAAALIRLARAEDLEPALQVWQAANAARGKIPTPARIARIRAKLADTTALVVVHGTTGMALAEPGHDEDGTPLPDLCHVSMVFVHPDHWGLRIGETLLDGVAAYAAQRGHTRLQLWTGHSNVRARRLYLRCGFTPTGRVKTHGGEEILQLRRPLSA